VIREPVHCILIEDVESDARYIEIQVEKHAPNVEMERVETGEEALERLESPERTYDLILMDWNLPGMSGVELLDSIRALPRMASVPVVVLTGSSSPQDASLAYEHAASAFVSKTLDIGQVLARNAVYCDFWDSLLPDRRELAPDPEA